MFDNSDFQQLMFKQFILDKKLILNPPEPLKNIIPLSKFYLTFMQWYKYINGNLKNVPTISQVITWFKENTGTYSLEGFNIYLNDDSEYLQTPNDMNLKHPT